MAEPISTFFHLNYNSPGGIFNQDKTCRGLFVKNPEIVFRSATKKVDEGCGGNGLVTHKEAFIFIQQVGDMAISFSNITDNKLKLDEKIWNRFHNRIKYLRKRLRFVR